MAVALALMLGLLPARATPQEIVVTVGEQRTVSVDPGSQFSVPVNVDMSNAGGQDLASLEFRLTWDASRLTLVSTEPGEFGDVGVDQPQGGGELSVNLSSPTGTASSFTVLTLTLEAGTSQGSATIVIQPLGAANEAGETLLGSIERRILGVCIGLRGLLGDVTGDGSVNIIDAQQIARFAVGLSVADADGVRRFGDVTDDGNVNIVDAQQVARFAVGLGTGSRAGEEAAGCLFAPVVSLLSPEDGAEFDDGEEISFQGSAIDPEDGDLTGDALVWTSDVDGEFGTGQTVTTSELSVATHQITLTGSDSDGNEATETMGVTVQPVPGSIAGQVFRSNDDVPFESVTVQLLQGEGVVKETMTDAQGAYIFGRVNVGSYTVQPVRDDLPPFGSFAVEPDQPISVASDEDVTGVDFGFRVPVIPLSTKLSSVSAAVGETVTVQLIVNDSEIPEPLAGTTAEVSWDPSLASVVTGSQSNPSGWDLVVVNEEQAGTFNVGAAAAQGVSGDQDGDVVIVAFAVTADATGQVSFDALLEELESIDPETGATTDLLSFVIVEKTIGTLTVEEM